MAAQKQCQHCKHFVTIKVPNDPSQYFCANERTKEGPNPIGFLRSDAPACALYISKRGENRDASAKVIFIAPAASPKPETIWDRIERNAVKAAIVASTILGLLGWLVWEVGSHFGTVPQF